MAGVAQGESTSRATDNSKLFGVANETTILGAAVGGVVLLVALTLFAWQQRRRGSRRAKDHDSDLAAEVFPVEDLPQNKTYSLDDYDGDHSYDSYDDDNTYDDDLEIGSKTGLSVMDSLHKANNSTHAQNIASPSATSNCRKGGLRLVSTVPVESSNSTSLQSSAVCGTIVENAQKAGDEELNTTVATDVTDPDHASLSASLMSSSAVAEGTAETLASQNETCDENLLPTVGGSDMTTPSHIPDDDDRRSMLPEYVQKRTYDTRSVLSTSILSDDEDALAIDISQEVVMVDAGPSWKNRWVRPNILQNLRLSGDHSDSVANNISSELYISRDDDSSASSSSTKSSSKNKPEVAIIGNDAPAENVDDESVDFKPSQDWNPDDSEVSTGDDLGNGELSFWTPKKMTELRSPESTLCPLASSTTVSTESQQGEELDGLDILEKLRLSPTLEVSLRGSSRMLKKPRGFMRK